MLLEMMAPCAAFTRRVAVASRLALAFAGGALLAVTALVPDAEAKTLRFAFQGELKAVDPYADRRGRSSLGDGRRRSTKG